MIIQGNTTALFLKFYYKINYKFGFSLEKNGAIAKMKTTNIIPKLEQS